MVVTDATGTPVQLEELDADWLLTLAEDNVTATRAAERDRMRLAAQWCVRHEVTDTEQAAWWGQVGGHHKGVETRLGAAGTPMVAEFAVEPFAAALQLSPAAGLQLLADVLDLQHRLPRHWARIEALEIDPWRARRVAQATTHLSVEAVAWVDEQVAPIAGTCGPVKLDRIVTEAAARFDPVSTAEDEADERHHYGIRLTKGSGSVFGSPTAAATLDIYGDTPTLTRFTDLIGQLAHDLLDPDRDGYRAEDLGQRQITALGLLCDQAEGITSPVTGDGQAPRPPRRGRGGGFKLYAHFDYADICQDLIRVGSVERLGPITLHTLREWIDLTGCTITPVVHMNRTDPVDHHDPPEWMAEVVRLRDRHCVFPWCTRDSRSCDLDHIEEFVEIDEGGPPGQTHPGNLAPLCRRHHRLKTSRRWRYQRNPDGSYTWTSPHGRQYTVTPDGNVHTH